MRSKKKGATKNHPKVNKGKPFLHLFKQLFNIIRIFAKIKYLPTH